jgi:hypothetical protein
MNGVLLDEPLVADPDADDELFSDEAEAIADEDLRGSRLLLVGRAEAIDLAGSRGSKIELASTFQPADGARFTSARLVLHVTAPSVKIIDVAPRDVRDEPVAVEVNHEGKLSLEIEAVGGAGFGAGKTKHFSTYHCAIQGSGAATAIARWEFKENPDRRDGLGTDQALALTLPVAGTVHATVTVTARLVRGAFTNRVADAFRDLVLPTAKRSYPVTFEIP